jgi:hypothetical protein
MDANIPVLGVLMPHPPLLIPDIGKEELEQVAKTKRAMEQLSQEMKIIAPPAAKFRRG